MTKTEGFDWVDEAKPGRSPKPGYEYTLARLVPMHYTPLLPKPLRLGGAQCCDSYCKPLTEVSSE